MSWNEYGDEPQNFLVPSSLNPNNKSNGKFITHVSVLMVVVMVSERWMNLGRFQCTIHVGSKRLFKNRSFEVRCWRELIATYWEMYGVNEYRLSA